MGFAAAAYAKAHGRRRICVATSSVGPGATNMVTAAAVAHANRLPVLFLSGDVFHHRLPHPVLQQVEHFGDPSISVNDAFKPVTRYWDRITHPAQLLQSLPAAIATMLDPADCGPAFLGLPQDVQGSAYDFPAAFFETRACTASAGCVLMSRSWPLPRRASSNCATPGHHCRRRGSLFAGRRTHWPSSPSATTFRWSRPLPACRHCCTRILQRRHFRRDRHDSANAICGEADVIIAVGTRLQDFTTGSWTCSSDSAQIIGLNAARFDASKHLALPIVGDAREGLQALELGAGRPWRADPAGTLQPALRDQWNNRPETRGSTPGGLAPPMRRSSTP
jgi:3D-(3,5/4)-trihydroxycyclohexane-1,2-dione acylhydrolase (decyclizing)